MQHSHKKFTGKIAAALLKKNGSYFIAQRKKKDGNEGLWEFPGGKQEFGETLQECLKRELFEEFGIHANIGDYACSSFFKLKDHPVEMCAFEVHTYHGELTCIEHNKIEWVKPEDFYMYNFTKPDYVFIEKILMGSK